MYSPHNQYGVPRLPHRFSLASLFGLTTLSALLLSLGSISVVLAILAALLLLPAMVANSMVAGWWREVGHPLSPSEWLASLVKSMLGVVAILFGSLAAAFYMAIAGAFLGGTIRWFGGRGTWSESMTTWFFAIGGLVGGGAGCFLVTRAILDNAAYNRWRKLARLRWNELRGDVPPKTAEGDGPFTPGDDAK